MREAEGLLIANKIFKATTIRVSIDEAIELWESYSKKQGVAWVKIPKTPSEVWSKVNLKDLVL